MAITINFNAETIVGNFCLGRIGEHNATELVITVPTALSGDPRTESYRVAFHTNGQTILSESYTESPITISLWRQLTLAPRLSLQVIAYDGAGDFVGKSVKLSGFYFEPSVMGDSVEADGSNPDLAHEILDIMAKNEEQDTRLDSDESAITALQNGKVDKVAGKGLSTEDYTTAEKEKLATLQNYVLPTASTSTLGGVKVDGETITITNGVIKATVQAGDYVRILTVTNGVANYGAGWLKQFHEEGKIVVYDECILEYSTETTNTIVYYYFDVKNSKQKKLTVTNSKDATIFEVQTYASNNQGISGTIKTLNEWLSQFNTDIGTLQVNLSTVQTSLANKQEKFVVINFTPTDTSDLTLGGTFDKTLAEMHELMSAGHYLLLKVVGVSATNVIQVGDSPSVFSAIYWQFITQNGNSRYLYTVGIDWQNGEERVIVRKFYFAPNEVTIDSTSKTVAEWITQLEGYNTITIGQQTKTVAEWVAYLQDQKAFKNVEIDGTTKTIALWLDQILDGQTYDSFSDVESAISSLSSQKVNLPSVAGTEGQVLSLDSNLNTVWISKQPSRLPNGYQEVEYIESTGTQWIDLGDMPTKDTRIRVEASLTTTENSRQILGCANNSSYYSGFIINAGTAGFFTMAYPSDLSWLVSNVPTDTNMHIFDLQSGKQMLDDNVFSTTYASSSFSWASTDVFSLFAISYYGSMSYGKVIFRRLYRYEKNVLMNLLVPCYRKSDNEIGVYDIIQQRFLTNAGTGTFLKGNDVN